MLTWPPGNAKMTKPSRPSDLDYGCMRVRTVIFKISQTFESKLVCRGLVNLQSNVNCKQPNRILESFWLISSNSSSILNQHVEKKKLRVAVGSLIEKAKGVSANEQPEKLTHSCAHTEFVFFFFCSITPTAGE